jgi:hypothetical protein
MSRQTPRNKTAIGDFILGTPLKIKTNASTKWDGSWEIRNKWTTFIFAHFTFISLMVFFCLSVWGGPESLGIFVSSP